MSAPEFQIDSSVLSNGTVLEASAGTGKTYSVASVVTRELALDDSLRIGGILITTFTRNAAAELSDRVRRRLVTVERQLRADTASADPLALELHGTDRVERADRLARALREFDNATISTIHSVCSRILAMAGEVAVGHGEGADPRRIVAEVVNDAVVTAAATGLVLQTKRLTEVVTELLGSPKAVLHHKTFPGADPDDAKKNNDLAAVSRIVRECVDEVHRRTELTPTFDDMLRRAESAVSDKDRPAVVAALRQRFSLAVIDEAQDTDHLQWSIFRHIFDGRHSSGRLIAVGDPKQAIYRFRGADVEAYLDARDENNMFTLSRNWRSDADLIRVLNTVFAGKTFGESITYQKVSARPAAPATAITGDVPLVLVDLGIQTQAEEVVEPAALRVREILATIQVPEGDAHRPVRPGEICVLVRANDRGSAIESRLRELGVSAVSSGTENVMHGEMSRSLVSLLQAMANPHDTSNVRIAAATPFFDRSLADAGSLSDAVMETIQSEIVGWNKTLRRRGVAALAAALRADPAVSARIVGGPDGERNETDFAHIVELLHAETGGSGCSAGDVLDCVAELTSREATAETVSRRVESDKDAVQIMTVHASKGLEFPVVVIADLWKRTGQPGVQVVYSPAAQPGGPRIRTIDAGHALNMKDSSLETQVKDAAAAEVDRLFYVAMTRARHHVSLLVSAPKNNEKAGRTTNGLLDMFRSANPHDPSVRILPGAKITSHKPYTVKGRDPSKMAVATVANPIIQTYDRLSFSSITKQADGAGHASAGADDRSGAGHNDDDEQIISIRSGYADETVKEGVDEMPLARLMGGTYFGKVVHKVYEKVDFAADPLDAEVARVVQKVVTGSVLRREHGNLIRGVELSLRTPLGGALGSTRLADIGAGDRLSELTFEMTLADWAKRSRVADIGRALEESLLAAGRADDPLVGYAQEIASHGFTTDLKGLMNGSIDSLLRVENAGQRELWITDYKSNRLDKDGDETLISGYGAGSMLNEMFHHHYPLQALIYGTAVNRYLRSRAGATGAPHVVRGFAYLFIRGMVGESTPHDGAGNRNGVVTWVAPDGLWDTLSDVMMGAHR